MENVVAAALCSERIGMLELRRGDFADASVLDLLRTRQCIAQTQAPPEAWRAEDIDALKSPEVSFWTAWSGDTLAGCGALKRLSFGHGEIRAMHTAQAMRGRGVGTAILKHLVSLAQTEGLARLSLETGSSEYFRPARRLYRSFGFVECEAFASYRDDPNSIFMSMTPHSAA